MIYMAGDRYLDNNGFADLKEMKAVGSTDEVAFGAQFRRGVKPRPTKRYYLRKDSRAGARAANVVEVLADNKKLIDVPVNLAYLERSPGANRFCVPSPKLLYSRPDAHTAPRIYGGDDKNGQQNKNSGRDRSLLRVRPAPPTPKSPTK